MLKNHLTYEICKIAVTNHLLLFQILSYEPRKSASKNRQKDLFRVELMQIRQIEPRVEIVESLNLIITETDNLQNDSGVYIYWLWSELD